MKEIIEDVLQAEEKVNRLLKQAREQAAQIKQAADKAHSEKIGAAREQARQIIHTAVEAAQKEAEQIRTDRLQQAEQAKDALLNMDSETRDHLVNEICTMLLETETEKEP